MIKEGRIDMNQAENDALNALLEEIGDTVLSASRSEPGEEGPLLVQSSDSSWIIDKDGNCEEEV